MDMSFHYSVIFIREAILKWLGRLERKPEEDLVMITWKWVDTDG